MSPSVGCIDNLRHRAPPNVTKAPSRFAVPPCPVGPPPPGPVAAKAGGQGMQLQASDVCAHIPVIPESAGRLEGAVDRELGGNIYALPPICGCLTFLRKHYVSSTFFEDPFCTKYNK